METIIDNVEFEIVKNIADGGMGSVSLARQKGVEGFEKTVAIKTLLPHLSSDQKFVEKFIAEAKLVANLVHENIVQIYQLGKSSSGSYFFVLEYVKGISLHEFQDIHNKLYVQLPPELAVFIVSRIARGLAYAHSRKDHYGKPLNIVHCDVCPHNILITTEGLPKLTDFGIAKAATSTQDDDTISGKLPYMSPEQARGEELDFHSDIYSLGVVLFYLLSGSLPRSITDDLDVLLREAAENYIDWDAMPSTIDPEAIGILKKMLSARPADRFSSTNELARSLEYHIYKNGYGPTIVTLAEYMQKNVPYLYELDSSAAPSKTEMGRVEKTLKVDMDRIAKTVKIVR